MAAKAVKIVLGKRPETFSRVVTFPMVDGSTGCMKVDYEYRTRKEFAAFADEIQAELKAAGDEQLSKYQKASEGGDDVPAFTQAEILAREAGFKSSYIMRTVRGWNLEIPFDREAVDQLVDELPAAAAAIIEAYREAIVEGRVGN